MKTIETFNYKPDYCDDDYTISIIYDDISGEIDFYANIRGSGLVHHVIGMFLTELEDIMEDIFSSVNEWIIDYMEEEDIFIDILNQEDMIEHMNNIRLFKPEVFCKFMNEGWF